MATSRPRSRTTRDLALVALLGEPGSWDALEGLIEALKEHRPETRAWYRLRTRFVRTFDDDGTGWVAALSVFNVLGQWIGDSLLSGEFDDDAVLHELVTFGEHSLSLRVLVLGVQYPMKRVSTIAPNVDEVRVGLID